MPDSRPTLLLTRPIAQSRRFAAAFAARFGEDWPVLIAPMQQIVALAPAVPQAREVIFTSENAVVPLQALSPAAGRRAWCVGARTAAAAAQTGFAPVAGPGDAAALAKAILAARPTGPLLLARGAHQAFDIAAKLNAAGIETFSAQVYAQEARPLSAGGLALLAGMTPVLVPLFSPRSARLFAEAAANAGAPLRIAAISPATARVCVKLGSAMVETAAQPEAESMLDALARLMAG
ncbi:uroporphyrinogen-III synthase [Phaeovulum sp.]|uniref:uroporphyrinogen-III synthase n=1 Tax=Phaeovulum sp. TaxID=2934796 RepID=UPI0027306508|nr:uroporphyrinogen-III synthase [Phaeovulum sp.]MDP1669082.1 uroporphyrinogen-III synthase [Phaeovulum sp.]MDZ4117721.1 uroporphyrinogen-III synthase [Phaeovulum sp.]